ncbi:MAG: hypothetical protein II984_00595 [Clostridia bacterium]|nr:hypothetical protein [Clostridia bacterium]
MKLTEKTLMKLAKGVTDYEKENGYILFLRFGKNQIDFMSQDLFDKAWLNWAKFTGGIRLEFKTNSENISFDYISSCSHPRANTVDLYIENKLHCVYKIEENLKGSAHFSLPSGEKTVTIYFPNESIFKIKNFTIDGSYKAIKSKKKTLLAYGDSITQGAGPEIASLSYINILNREYKYEIIDQGIGGYRFEAGHLMKIDGVSPDRIIVALGTNYYEPRDDYDYEKAVSDYFKRLNEIYPDVKKLVITPIYRTRELDNARFEWCRETIKREALKYGNTYVADGKDLMPNDPVTLSDGVHPSSYGSMMMGKSLIEKMKELKF